MENQKSFKTFDSSYKIEDTILEKLIKSCNNTPTAFNLQTTRLVVIKNQEIKDQLEPHSYGNKQIGTCSALFVFCVPEDFQIDNIREEKQDESEDPFSCVGPVFQLNSNSNVQGVKKYLSSKKDLELKVMTKNHAYLTLGVLLQEVAKQGLDYCPIEGFNVDQYETLLGLKELNLKPVILCAVGKGEELPSGYIKRRIPIEKFSIIL